MITRKLRNALALAGAGMSLTLLLSGCGTLTGPMTDGGTGVVVKKAQWKCNVHDRNNCRRHSITTARDGSGTRDTGFVSEKTYKACKVGDRWPKCRDDAK